jgi:hypothetical protein
MLTSYFGTLVFPNEIAMHKDWFNAEGKIIWGKTNFKSMKFEKRLYKCYDGDIRASLKDPNRAVMLEVNNGQHWVVATKASWLSNDYTCVDPWDGKRKSVLKNYHNITGSAHFIRKYKV